MWVRYSGHNGGWSACHDSHCQQKKYQNKKNPTACSKKPLVNEIMACYFSAMTLYLTNKHHQTSLSLKCCWFLFLFTCLWFIPRFGHPYQIWWDWLLPCEVDLQDITFKWLSTVLSVTLISLIIPGPFNKCSICSLSCKQPRQSHFLVFCQPEM